MKSTKMLVCRDTMEIVKTVLMFQQIAKLNSIFGARREKSFIAV